MSETYRRDRQSVHPEIVEAVLRASNRSAALHFMEMKQGIDILATIANIAPLLGLFATVTGIVHAFGGGSTERSTLMAAIAQSLSESLWPTAMGMAIGVMACFFHSYLADRLDDFRTEMRAAGLVLANELSRYRGPWQFSTASARTAPAAPSASWMNFDVSAVWRAAVARWGYRWVLPAAQAVVCGLLGLADRVIPMDIADAYAPVSVPFGHAIGAVINAPAYWITANLTLLFERINATAGFSIAVVGAPAFTVCVWYLVGAWIDAISVEPVRMHRHRIFHWCLLLPLMSLYAVTFVDVTAGFFSREYWAPAVAFSRWMWLSFFVYAQISALRRESHPSRLPRLF